jgi:hypothetical protein
MIQGRMLGSNISLSEKVADLSCYQAKLLYTWSLSHTDHLRLLPASARTIKGAVIPLEDTITTEMVEEYIQEFLSVGLYILITYKDKQYYYVPDPQNINNLRKDRQPKSILPLELDENAKISWEKAEILIEKLVSEAKKPIDNRLTTIGCHLTATRQPLTAEDKIREEKRNKYNGEQKPASPEDKKSEQTKPGVTSVGDILASRIPSIRKTGISTAWQDKAFRYANELKIDLPQKLKGRWINLFKTCNDHPDKSKILESTFSYLIDYPPFTSIKTSDGKVMYFFKIFDNGGPSKKQGFISVKYLLIIALASFLALLSVLWLGGAGIADSDLPKNIKKDYTVRRPSPSASPSIVQRGDQTINQIINVIHTLESSKGKAAQGLHIYCRNRGMWNEYGYDSPHSFCFNNKLDANITLYFRFKRQIEEGWTMPQMLCYYNTGGKLDDCPYYQESLKVKGGETYGYIR